MLNGEKKFVVSNGAVNYFIIHTGGEGAAYGIYAEVEKDAADFGLVRNIFFTEEEAAMRCKWLSDNRVYPIALVDTLRNIV